MATSAAVNPAGTGTKVAAVTRHSIAPGASAAVRLRFTNRDPFASGGSAAGEMFGKDFDEVFAQRIAEADEFYAARISPQLSPDAQSVQRQALAGMLLSKQSYHYDVRIWLEGDPMCPPPRRSERRGATTIGNIFTTPTSFPCPTSGSIPGTPRGIWRFTPLRCRWWIRISPRNN
jgi:hypothetical protein